MKKFLSLLICFILVLSLMSVVGCNSQNNNSTPQVFENLTELALVNDGVAPAAYLNPDSGVPHFIDGTTSNISVQSGNAAINSLNSVKEIMGIKNPNDEFIVKVEDSSGDYIFYRLQQMYKGIEVYGKQLVVSAHSNGTITGLSGDYLPDINVSTTPQITETQAKNIVKELLCANDDGILSIDVVIYAIETEPTLAYKIAAYGNEDAQEVFINAMTGEVIANASLGTAFDWTTEGVNGKMYTIAVEEVTEDYYRFYDPTRKISIRDAGRYYGQPDLDDIEDDEKLGFIIRALLFDPFFDVVQLFFNPDIIPPELISEDTLKLKQSAVSAMANFSKAYDYYKQLGRDSYDNKGSEALVIIGIKDDLDPSTDGYLSNAYSATTIIGGQNYFGFGVTSNDENGIPFNAALDVVAHEFTHAVTRETASLLYTNDESGALNEAYSDIMGSLLEGKNWTMGEDIGIVIRDASNPESDVLSIKYPSKKGGQYYFPDDEAYWKNHPSIQRWLAKKQNKGKDWTEYRGQKYINGSVVSHAAYLMYAAGAFSSREQMARVWYDSLLMLTPTSDFEQCAQMVLKAAKIEGLSQDSINKITQAFIDTNMSQPYEISLRAEGQAPGEPYIFATAIEKYSAQPALTAIVTNTGVQPTGTLRISLSGGNSSSFVLSAASISGIAVDNNAKCTIRPIEGLGVGTYNETVTVSGDNMQPQSFDVRFTVIKTPDTVGLIFDVADGKFYYNTNTTSGTSYTKGAEYNGQSGSWNWDTTTNTLSLDGFVWYTSAPTALFINGSVTISLAGNGDFVSTNAASISQSYGIYVTGSGSTMTVNGSGMLISSGGNPIGSSRTSYGIYSPNIIVDSGTINATGGDVTGTSGGIRATSRLTANYGTVSAKGGTATNSYGIYGSFTFNGGTVTAKSGTRALSNITLNASGYSYWTNGSDPGTDYPGGDAFTYSNAYVYVRIIAPKATYGIGISIDTIKLENGLYTFPAVPIGYPAQPNISFTVTNVGNQPTGAQKATLSGENMSSFTLSGASMSSIPGGEKKTFSVSPKTKLGVGTYTATVTVANTSGLTVESQSFDVSFTVEDVTPGLIFDAADGRFYYNTNITNGNSFSESYKGSEYTEQRDEWEWDSNTSTLTLKGFVWESGAPTALMIVNGNVTVSIEDGTTSSFVSINKASIAASRGIYVAGSNTITITGSGTLNVTGGNPSGSNSTSYGIEASSINIYDGTIKATGRDTTGTSGGIRAVSRLTVNGGMVYATGGTANTSYGIYGSFTYKGGMLEAIGNSRALSNSPTMDLLGYMYKVNTDASNPSDSYTHTYPGIAFTYSNTYKYVGFSAPRASYGISLDGMIVNGLLKFPSAMAGCLENQTPATITVRNVGSQATGALSATLSGNNADAFTLTGASMSSIAVSNSKTFTVVPKKGLELGTYMATVTVANTSGSTVEPQSFDISFTVKNPKSLTNASRCSVLVLDASPSMADESMFQMKKAVQKFVSQMFDDQMKEQNYVAIVAYSQDAVLIWDFDNNEADINAAIKNIDKITRNGTNTYAGLAKAKEMLSSVPSESIKNIVLMTDGMPNQNVKTDDGPYSVSDCNYREIAGGIFGGTLDYTYRFANGVYNLANEVKKSANIYTLGFFQDFREFYPENVLPFAQRILRDAASSPNNYYEVVNADDFVFAFGEIAENITDGKYTVIRIACPVDVTINHNGSTLSSAAESLSVSASFGYLNFTGPENDIKVVHLKGWDLYELVLTGNAQGSMDYTVSWYDADGELIKEDFIGNVPITGKTIINTNTDNDSKTVLYSDIDGDGKITTFTVKDDTEPDLELSAETWEPAGSSATVTVDVETNMEWTTSSDEDWLSVSPESGSGNATLILNVTTNESESSRTGTITVNAGTLEKTITVIQAGKVITVPGAPANVSATAGSCSAMVSFTAPQSNGGSAITSYTVTSNPGNITVSGASSPITISGLTNGTPYTFTVKATNSAGTGPESGASNAVIPAESVILPTGITVSPETAELKVSDTKQLSATVQPADADNKTVTWTSNNEEVATVTTSGLVTAIAPGVVTITAETANELKASCTVTVASSPIQVTDVSVSPANVTLKGSQTQQLTVTITPEDATNKKVTYSTSVSSVATVSGSGLITAVGAGTTKIEVETEDGGFKAYCDITVISSDFPDAPRDFKVIPGNKQAALSWSAPLSDGGSEITSYEVSDNGGTTWITAQSDTGHTFTGLTNGILYTFKVCALNTNGAGAEATVTSTPFASIALDTDDPDHLTVTQNNRTYNGNRYALVNAVTTTGLAIEYRLNNGGWSTDIPKAKDAGSYTVDVRITGDGTYYTGLIEKQITVVVSKANLTITPTVNPREVCAGSAVTYSWTYSGFVSGENANVLNGVNTITVSSGYNPATSPAGAYPLAIDISGVTSANYSISAGTGNSLVVRNAIVTYDANGGTGGTVVPNIAPGTSHVVLSSAEANVSKQGYMFAGWKTGDVQYKPGDTLTVKGDVTLYAVWNVTKYPIISNIDTYTGSGNLIIRIDAPYSHFIDFYVNGKALSTQYYTVTEGSTIITLKEAWLKTLKNGTYDAQAEFTDGVTHIQFEVKAQKSDSSGSNSNSANGSPSTGDESNVWLWFVLGILSILGITGLLIWKKRGNQI